MPETPDTVAAVRRFNRFYTRAIGVLERGYLGGPYTLAENRVMYEVSHGEMVTPSAIAAALDLDAGYLSRMLSKLERDGMLERRRSNSDGRSVTLRLTPRGQDYFASLNARTIDRVHELIGGLTAPDKARLAGALDTAQTLLQPAPDKAPIVLRGHQTGDMGWVTDLCRNVGLMVHNVRHPDASHRTIVRKDVHEEDRGDVTLRRTTIEEIEFKKKTDDRT